MGAHHRESALMGPRAGPAAVLPSEWGPFDQAEAAFLALNGPSPRCWARKGDLLARSRPFSLSLTPHKGTPILSPEHLRIVEQMLEWFRSEAPAPHLCGPALHL